MKDFYKIWYYKASNEDGDIIIFNDCTRDVLRLYKKDNTVLHALNTFMDTQEYYENLINQGWSIDKIKQV